VYLKGVTGSKLPTGKHKIMGVGGIVPRIQKLFFFSAAVQEKREGRQRSSSKKQTETRKLAETLKTSKRENRVSEKGEARGEGQKGGWILSAGSTIPIVDFRYMMDALKKLNGHRFNNHETLTGKFSADSKTRTTKLGRTLKTIPVTMKG